MIEVVNWHVVIALLITMPIAAACVLVAIAQWQDDRVTSLIATYGAAILIAVAVAFITGAIR